mmetsp:Transcript_16783/g.24894  ORF Transcript_16783/g.24894 Transcript_16783/m.24894 type:complete len:253 (-) Transcript_16783:91-849(-)
MEHGYVHFLCLVVALTVVRLIILIGSTRVRHSWSTTLFIVLPGWYTKPSTSNNTIRRRRFRRHAYSKRSFHNSLLGRVLFFKATPKMQIQCNIFESGIQTCNKIGFTEMNRKNRSSNRTAVVVVVVIITLWHLVVHSIWFRQPTGTSSCLDDCFLNSFNVGKIQRNIFHFNNHEYTRTLFLCCCVGCEWIRFIIIVTVLLTKMDSRRISSIIMKEFILIGNVIQWLKVKIGCMHIMFRQCFIKKINLMTTKN